MPNTLAGRESEVPDHEITSTLTPEPVISAASNVKLKEILLFKQIIHDIKVYVEKIIIYKLKH